MYLWLSRWPIDRLRLSHRKGSAAPAEKVPFATVADTAGRRLLAAVNPAAAAAGLAPGMPLTDALSFLPGLATAVAEPAEDAAALRRLAEWCGRYSPWTAPDGADGVRIEITGSSHLWGGERALAADLLTRLDHRGVAGRIAVADTLGAAWAIARFAEMGESIAILSAEGSRAVLAPLPVEALRLDPSTALGLRRVGLKRIGDLYAMPRSALAQRFGEIVAELLDRALDNLPEPLSPLSEVPSRRVRLSFAEPITEPDDLMLATERLTADLIRRLAREGTGARWLDLAFHRVDGRVERIRLGTARPSRDPHHLAALFRERLDTVDPGLGIEDMILAAFAIEPLPPEQIGFLHHNPPPRAGEGWEGAGNEASGVAPLLDRLGNRLGLAALSRLEARESHIPERASVRVPVSLTGNKLRFLPPLPPQAGGEGRGEGGCWSETRSRPPHPPVPAGQARGLAANAASGPSLSPLKGGEGLKRPIRLFEPPEPIDAFWVLPDDPPFRFMWRRRRHRVTQADGPERIAEEWWLPEAADDVGALRDYYRVEDEEGRRFWLFRAGLHGGDRKPRWFIHGVFS
jgi:protein ImuB